MNHSKVNQILQDVYTCQPKWQNEDGKCECGMCLFEDMIPLESPFQKIHKQSQCQHNYIEVTACGITSRICSKCDREDTNE